MNNLYACPCCGEKTLEDIGEFDICNLCKWQDDPLQREDHDDKDGPNGGLSLNEYKAAWEAQKREAKSQRAVV